MRFKFALTTFLVLGTSAAMAQDLSTEKGKLSYAVGWNLGTDIGRQVDEFDVEVLVTAIRDSAAGRDPQVEMPEMRRLLTELQERVRQEQLAALQQLAEENQAKAESFLAENKGKSGVVELPSGVQYRILEEGDGARPGLEDTVTVHYRSSKLDDLELDSSFARGVPQEFTVNQVLQGWQEVLPLMKVGATWQIWVPPELAFGQRGTPPTAGPNEALKFDLKLVEIVDG